MNAQWIDRFSGTKNWVRALAATSVVTLGMLGISANPANAATVPFKSKVAGTVTQLTQPGPPTFALAGAGSATGLGAASYSGTVTVTSAPGVVPLTDDLSETLTASNGDTLTLLCHQTATPIGSTGVLHGTDQWTVTGGTGRFAHASGSGTGDTYIYNLALFTKSATGTINVGR